MHFVTDLHLHSKYSRAVSQNMTLPVMAQFAKQKGIDILSATDFTHPLWFKEIQVLLEEAEGGLYKLKTAPNNANPGKDILFLLSTEISSIYKQGEKLRRIHNLVIMPDLASVEKFSNELVRRGCNISSDGRPIIGISSRNLLEMVLSINDRALLIPCHIWTPHFGIYGSASGFDSLEEAFGDLANHVYGIETGLSSDPDMNWQVAELKNRTILSTSDAHSPAKMGREATVFEMEEPGYENIRAAIMKLSAVSGQLSDSKKQTADSRIAYTIEFYPEEGKYHFSGHRNCKVVQGPEEIKESGGICPVCRRRLTEGVLFRVQQLSDESLLNRVEVKGNTEGLSWHVDRMKIQPPYVKIVPLLEVVAEAMGSTVASQKVHAAYNKLCQELTSEFHVLLHAPIADIRKAGSERIAEAIMKVRGGDITINPGYDGEFGKVKIWDAGKKKEPGKSDMNHESPQLELDI